MKFLGLKKGFTLVEMLVVISIVGILATFSIGQYNQFRRVSVLDLAADSIVANINDARDGVAAGKVVGDGSTSMCFGLKFEAGIAIEKVIGNFDVSKKWDGKKWVYKGCSELDATVSGESLSIGEGIIVENGDCTILFSPPNGDVDGSFCRGIVDGVAEIVIGYGDGNTDLQRKISINLNTGKTNVQ